jgi:hypothetical protein
MALTIPPATLPSIEPLNPAAAAIPEQKITGLLKAPEPIGGGSLLSPGVSGIAGENNSPIFVVSN